MTREASLLSVLLATITPLAGCSTAVPLGIPLPEGSPESAPGQTYRGVVNGVWKYDPAANRKRLQGPHVEASPEDAARLADRHQVRVGIDRSLIIGEYSEVVLLPDGWSYSLDALVDDGRTVNVGDVVEVRQVPASGLQTVTTIVRKCSEPPLPEENPDWDIGCKRIESFHRDGYGGETYYLTAF